MIISDNDVSRRVIEDLKIVRGGLINKDEFIEAALKSQVNNDISRYCILPIINVMPIGCQI